jgi:hypothetical protein
MFPGGEIVKFGDEDSEDNHSDSDNDSDSDSDNDSDNNDVDDGSDDIVRTKKTRATKYVCNKSLYIIICNNILLIYDHDIGEFVVDQAISPYINIDNLLLVY